MKPYPMVLCPECSQMLRAGYDLKRQGKEKPVNISCQLCGRIVYGGVYTVSEKTGGSADCQSQKNDCEGT